MKMVKWCGVLDRERYELEREEMMRMKMEDKGRGYQVFERLEAEVEERENEN